MGVEGAVLPPTADEDGFTRVLPVWWMIPVSVWGTTTSRGLSNTRWHSTHFKCLNVPSDATITRWRHHPNVLAPDRYNHPTQLNLVPQTRDFSKPTWSEVHRLSCSDTACNVCHALQRHCNGIEQGEGRVFSWQGRQTRQAF